MLIEDINRCKKFFDNPNDEDYGRTIYDEITGRYDLIIPDFGNGLYQYFSEQHFYDPDISGNTLKFNLKKLMNKMETYLALKYPAVNIAGENQPKDNSSEKGGVKKLSKEVFIVHGHDDARAPHGPHGPRGHHGHGDDGGALPPRPHARPGCAPSTRPPGTPSP